MKRNLTVLFFLVVSLAILNPAYASSSKENSVIVQVKSDHKIYSTQKEVSLLISINDSKLYNDNVFLSYHLYDKKGDELLWEGERIPFKFEENKKTSLDIRLKIPEKFTEAQVKFDFVDTQNLYWFSEKKIVTSDIVVYEKNELLSKIKTISENVKHAPFIFGINTFFLILVSVLFVYSKKKRIFYK